MYTYIHTYIATDACRCCSPSPGGRAADVDAHVGRVRKRVRLRVGGDGEDKGSRWWKHAAAVCVYVLYIVHTYMSTTGAGQGCKRPGFRVVIGGRRQGKRHAADVAL